jgi:hypothetical protein
MLEHVATVALISLGLAYTGAKLDGPFGLSTWLKTAILNSAAPAWVQTGIECVYCWSFWLTLGIAVAVTGLGNLNELVRVWLAAFGLVTIAFLWAGQ